jgi:O-antigen/teichoic acid export membrane protein
LSVSIYSLGVSLAERVWLIPDALKDILLSRLVKGKTEEEVARVIRTSIFFCMLSIVIIALLGKDVISFLYGTEFSGSYNITIIMLFGLLSMVLYKMIYSYNIVNGHRIVNLLFLGLAALINIVGNYFLIPLLGIVGAALTSVISYSICGVLFLVYFKKKSRIPIRIILFVTRDDYLMLRSKLKPLFST